MSFSHTKTVQYAVKYTRSVRYLDLALSRYEKLETDSKVAAAAIRLKYEYKLLDRMKYLPKTPMKEILEAVSNFYDVIIKDFFNAFEEKVYKAIFEEDQEEFYIERYIAACRKTNILEVDHEKAILRQKGLFHILHVLLKTKFYCPNSTLFINFLQTFCNDFILGSRIYTEEDYMKHLDLILEQCKKMKYMLWGAWPTYKSEGEPYNPVSTYLFMANPTYLKLVFKYGIDYAFSMSAYKITCTIFSHLKNEGRAIWERNTFIKLLGCKNRERMHLILLNFCIFFFNIDERNSNNRTCLELMWRAVPDAIVTAAEMTKVLKPLINNQFKWILEKTVKLYRDSTIFNNQQTLYAPRTLSHQCRGVIRRTLSKNFNLPEGVDGFDLPKKLKDFISLKC